MAAPTTMAQQPGTLPPAFGRQRQLAQFIHGDHQYAWMVGEIYWTGSHPYVELLAVGWHQVAHVFERDYGVVHFSGQGEHILDAKVQCILREIPAEQRARRAVQLHRLASPDGPRLDVFISTYRASPNAYWWLRHLPPEHLAQLPRDLRVRYDRDDRLARASIAALGAVLPTDLARYIRRSV